MRGPSADRSLLSPALDVEPTWQNQMSSTMRSWGCDVCPMRSWSAKAQCPRELAGEMQKHRLSSEYDYANLDAGGLRGAGACMACVVQRSDGSLTRACVHGPVFPLSDLLR